MPMFLVTGNKGFIGRHLQAHLEKQGHEVYGLDRLGDHNLTSALQRVPWERIEKIYHLGAITDTRCCEPQLFWDYNVEFTIKLLGIANIRMIPIHYASSAAVYGNQYKPNIPNPLNQYAMSKLMVDYHVRDHKWDTNIVGFRFFNVYGMDERKGSTASLVNKLIHAKEPTIFRASAVYFRDFVCIEDVVEVLTKMYKNGIYDIGTGKAINLVELADGIMEYTGREYSLIPMPKDLKPQYQEYTVAGEKPDELEKFYYKSVGQWVYERQDEIRKLHA
jgi:ADP-L-glycero-D-manno-heptose 6-epimerase